MEQPKLYQIINNNNFINISRLSRRTMSQSSNINSGKKLIRIDVSSDSVCPWCVIGKKNLDKAIAQSKDQFDFEVRWHPYLLNPSAPKQGVSKRDIHRQKLGPQYETIMAQTVEMFRGMGLEYDLSGLTGNTMDSHRLIIYAAHQGYDKQHALVEELFVGYFSKGKFIGDHRFLVECADKVGIEGAAEFLKDPNNGVQEVYADLQKYSGNLTGVPYYVVNGKHKLNGGQQPEVFLTTFLKAAKDSD